MQPCGPSHKKEDSPLPPSITYVIIKGGLVFKKLPSVTVETPRLGSTSAVLSETTQQLIPRSFLVVNDATCH